MKKVILLFYFLFLSIIVLPQVVLEKTYSDTNLYRPANAIAYNGGFLLLSDQYHGNRSFSYLFRTDSAGNILWSAIDSSIQSKNLLISGNKIYLLQAKDSNLISRLLISEYDSNGTMISRYILDPFTAPADTLGIYPSAFCKSADGGYFVTGYRDSSIEYLQFVFKLDSLFQIQWIYEENLNYAQSQASSIIQTSTGEVLIFAEMGWGGPSVHSSNLLKLSAGGQFIWEKYYPGCNGNSLFENDNGQYVIAGSQGDPWSGPPVAFHGYIYRIDTAGNTIWNYTSLPERFTSTCKGPDDEILVTGYESVSSPYCARLFAMAFDSAGNFLFRRYFRSDICAYSGAINSGVDSEIIICGIADTIADSLFNPTDFYLIVTNKTQSLLADVTEAGSEPVIIYPNPVRDVMVVAGETGDQTLQLLSMTGKLVREFRLQKGRQRIDVHDLPAGMFLIRTTSGNQQIRYGKIIRID